jgi:hypothetical protein
MPTLRQAPFDRPFDKLRMYSGRGFDRLRRHLRTLLRIYSG